MIARNLRLEKGLSLSKVAKMLGISSMQLSRIERGIDGMKIIYAKKLAEIYDVEWSIFYD